MHVIAPRTIREFAVKHPDAANPLMDWLAAVRRAEWADIVDVRKLFTTADPVKVASGNVVYVFNIKGNSYRLIAAIHFNRRRVFILRFMTHAEYSKNSWKGRL